MKMKTMKEDEIGETQKNENNRWEIDILKKRTWKNGFKTLKSRRNPCKIVEKHGNIDENQGTNDAKPRKKKAKSKSPKAKSQASRPKKKDSN